MQLRLVVIGAGAPELSAAEKRYLDRLKYFVDMKIIEGVTGRGKQKGHRLREEEQFLLAHAGDGFILFDESGVLKNSQDWADYFERQAQGSCHDFVIGGPDGVSNVLKSRASSCWSLSRLTFPHQLVRLIILEQFFRSFSIIKGLPYHRA